MARLDWLTARPIAHRGLHDRASGVIENTPTAVARALDHDFAVEIDVQRTVDGEAVVFHDETVERLLGGSGEVAALTLADLRAMPFKETADRIWTLDECLDLVGGRQALVVEIKSSRAAADGFAAGVARRLAARGGPVAAKSFDPRAVRAARAASPGLPLGVIGEAFDARDSEWSHLSGPEKFAARNLLHWPLTRPDFLSWSVRDLERPAVRLARRLGAPVMTWTVRTSADQARAALFADQMVFEGFVPA